MAVAGISPWELFDLQAQLHSRSAAEVFDVRVRSASPRDRSPPLRRCLAPGAPAPPEGAPVVDPLWPNADVSLRDLPGATLVTYGRHIEWSEVGPSEPKSVYVQYRTWDPVTYEPSSVVVPAQLCLDVFADPNFNYTPVVEEEEEEEIIEDKEEEDRRKLRSSIKGDPILLRAKPAPPPEAYFAPLRQECMANTSGLFAAGVSGSCDTSAAFRNGKASVQGSGTMSSFLKACGKDKYCRSRLDEIDRIVEQALPVEPLQAPPEDFLDVLPGFVGGGGDAGGAGAALDNLSGDPRSLAAHMAVHIRQMPKFRKGGGRRARLGTANHGDSMSLAASGEESPGADDPPKSKKDLPPSGGEWDELTSMVGDGLASGAPTRRNSQTSIGSAATAAAAAEKRASGLGSARGEGRRQAARSANGRLPGLRPQKVKLRDLDPHVSLAGTAPTQRLHGNWPDGLKRSIARHFYGLSPGKILEEEEKERIRDLSKNKVKESASADPADDPSSEPASPTSPGKARSAWLEPLRKGSPERIAQERRIARSVAGVGMVAHGLEVRIKNSDRPGRVVVGRHTSRARGREEAAGRHTLLPDKLAVDQWRLPRSARG